MFRTINRRIKRLPKKVKVGLPVLLILLFLIGSSLSSRGETTPEESILPLVEVSAAGSLAPDNMSNTFTGTVVSSNKAILRAESQGQITNIYKRRGDYVGRGTLIAQLENTRERAAVAQAEAGVKVAEANLSKLTNESSLGQETSLDLAVREAEKDLEEARQDAVLGVDSIYFSIDSAILSYIDPLFDNARGPIPVFKYSAELRMGNARQKLNDGRRQIRNDLINWERDVDNASTVEEKLEITSTYLEKMRPFFEIVVEAASGLRTSDDLTTTEIADIKSKATSAHSALLSAIGNAQAYKDDIDANERALVLARTNRDIGYTGSQNEDAIIAEAQLTQAEATLQTARVSYEKTLVRSPINGTLTALTIEIGDVLSPLAEIGTVSSTGNLEISVYVGEDDAQKLTVGEEARINGTLSGSIQEIEPTLDPITQKREVIIRGDTSSGITQGEIVSVRIINLETTSSPTIYLPLSALKVTPEETVVFSVSKEMTLTALPIEIDSIQGEYAIISEGLSPDTLIIKDARGHRAGESVRTQ